MRKLKSVLLALVFVFVTLSQQSCIGSFQLTKNLYEWNQNEVGGKWGSELVFLAFVVIPVYSVTLLADGVVLNSIEFWTGSNPMAMKAGEKDTQIVQKGDEAYKVSTQKNIVSIEKISGENAGETGDFVWNEETGKWKFVGGGHEFLLQE